MVWIAAISDLDSLAHTHCIYVGTQIVWWEAFAHVNVIRIITYRKVIYRHH